MIAGPPIENLDALYPPLRELYVDLHSNPELSLREEKTSAKLAARLRELGFEVTERVGGLGVVGVLKNGSGPTVLVRTDMDALPVKELTELPYASTVTTKNDAGDTVSVMHACGHDAHMTCWIGAATLLSQTKDRWHGTLVFVGQPAEEIVHGARAMIADGLFTRFPKPDYVVGLHLFPTLPAGNVGIAVGPVYAASDAVDITFYGKGGHGASPHQAVDPIVIAARAVVTLQTIVAREVNPLDPAVVTVGSFHAGTKRNIIPDEATLKLTVRSYKPEVQQKLLAAIARIAKAEAQAGNAPREPDITVHKDEGSEVVVNDPALAARMMTALQRGLGEDRVSIVPPAMGSEDFGLFGQAAGAPSINFRIGAINPKVWDEAEKAGRTMLLPSLHSPRFAPDPEPTLKTGTAAFTLAVMELLGPGAPASTTKPAEPLPKR